MDSLVSRIAKSAFFKLTSSLKYSIPSVLLVLLVLNYTRIREYFFESEYKYINKDAVKKITRLTRLKNVISFNAGDGDAQSISELSQRLQEKAISLKINKYCFSSCSELILPYAKHIEFVNNPIVGFGAPVELKSQLIKQYTGGIYRDCFSAIIDQKTNIYAQKGLSANFWQLVSDRLVTEPVHYIRPSSNPATDNECGEVFYNSEISMWLPNSQQLRDLLGLKFGGSVCADDVEKCTIRLNQSYRDGTVFLVGKTKITTASDVAK